MVLFALMMGANVENVAEIKLTEGCNICIDVQNPLSDYETREKVVVNSSELVESEGRGPPHHFSLKWEGNSKAATLKILSTAEAKAALKKSKRKDILPRSFLGEDSGRKVTILILEVRGLEPTKLHPLGQEFVVTSSGGTEFEEDVDLSDDWADYDTENDLPISICDAVFSWEAI